METTLLVAPVVDLAGLLPVLTVVGASLAVLLLDAFAPASRRALHGVALAALAAAFATTLGFLGARPADPFPGMYSADGVAHVFDLVFYLAAAAALLLSARPGSELRRGEYLSLVLLAVAGMVVLAHAASLVVVFLGVELLSVALYALTGYFRERERSVEAALKYFFLGAFASAFLVFGMALVYGATGTFDIGRIAIFLVNEQAAEGYRPTALLAAGAGMLLVGLFFKISSVPFHMWTPDVYEGAPTPIAAFMSVGTKAAAFAALLRVFTEGLGSLGEGWKGPVAAVAVATMLVGNLVGLTQRNLKRLLAFSSIAHAGYALVGLVAWESGGVAAVVFYLVAYAFMNLGAFGVVASLEHEGEGLHLYDLAGLSRRRPLLAAAMALFLLSLAGVPPTAGFVGKFGLFLAAVEGGYTWLAVLGVLWSLLAAYYYLRVIVVMYMQPESERAAALPALPASAVVVLATAVAGVLVLGLAPGGLLGVLERIVGTL